MELLQQQLYKQLEYFDQQAFRARRRGVLLRSLQTMILAALPMLLIVDWRMGNELLTLSSIVLSVVALLLSALTQFFDDGSRWQLYRTSRDELMEQLLRLRTMGTESDESESVKLQAMKETLELIRRRELSVLYAIDPRASEFRAATGEKE